MSSRKLTFDELTVGEIFRATGLHGLRKFMKVEPIGALQPPANAIVVQGLNKGNVKHFLPNTYVRTTNLFVRRGPAIQARRAAKIAALRAKMQGEKEKNAGVDVKSFFDNIMNGSPIAAITDGLTHHIGENLPIPVNPPQGEPL